MQPEHMNLSRRIGHFFATIYAQIKLDTRKGFTDLSKAQEQALLPIINEIFSKKFDDLNKININYPGIDYGDFDDGLGLQMTITVTKQKIQETLNKISKYDEDKRIKKLWMLFLTVEAVPQNVMVNSADIEIEYMTLKDLEDKVITADLDYQRKYLSLIEREYSSYFRANTSFSLPQNTPIPKDLSIFNDFIQTQEWFPDDPNEGYEKVYNFISSFQNCLLDCSSNARDLLSCMIEIQRIPKDYNSHIKIVLEKLVGRLNILDEDFDNFVYDLELLKSNHLIDLNDEFQGLVGNVIKTKKVAILRFKTYEPEINLFSVLPNFYLKYYSLNDFLRAIRSADFSLLSDQKIKSSYN
ncbi:hypothetical protein AVENLUH5627_00638 [Acinetobacter venetianus]|uniref:SMEK domain-containing protein n=1 Tax=Acinetobacter venetianus TaxID=52133 RepID=A0A150I264_9GAMM|nr:SMEK domain-containing protein [Acinetobacter venetianus]KXZ73482.1 hypothetical protein AVENLUH5627_00638 [Acinetobacter venetianus]